MGTGEAPSSDPSKWIRARRLPWLPAQPEAAFGLPMTEGTRRPLCPLRGFRVSVVNLYL